MVSQQIKELRKMLSLTQAEFSARIGMKQNSIAQIEGGRNTSEQTILAICREFNVNESWLRTGMGTVFTEVSTEVEIENFVRKAFQGKDETFKRRFIVALSHLDDAGWKALETMVVELSNGKN